MDVELQAKYYDDYWVGHQETMNHHELERMAMIFYALSERTALSGETKSRIEICDLGCGRGWLSDILSHVGAVTGVDFSRLAIEKARRKYPEVEFSCANALDYCPEKRYDLVVSSEVIEHIDNQPGYLSTAAQILKPGGFLLLTCPNGRQWDAWQSVNASRQPIEKWLSGNQLQGMLRRNFDVKLHTTFYLYFSYKSYRRLFNAPKLVGFLKKIGLLFIVESIRRRCGEGLYQIVLAQKKS